MALSWFQMNRSIIASLVSWLRCISARQVYHIHFVHYNQYS